MGSIVIGYFCFSYVAGFLRMLGAGAGERWSSLELVVAPVTMAGVIIKSVFRRLT